MNESIAIKILVLSFVSFVAAIAITPALTHFLYRYRLSKSIRMSPDTPIYSRMHQKKEGTPTMGGILVWFTVLAIAVLFSVLANIFSS
ncbi:MAG: hypothetical protein WC289_05200, partial [Patescibacteria group bacterium]